MKFDEFGCLVMERDGYPADIGDSAHETARAKILGYQVPYSTFRHFVSSHGFLRHPNAPFADARGESWRESDASSDMVFPLLMALDLFGPNDLRDEVRRRIKQTWTVAPGHIASPGLLAVAYHKPRLLAFLTRVQAAIFKIGWRWSDSNEYRDKWWKMERTDGSPADYLNWFCSIVYLWKYYRIRIQFDPITVEAKIRAYYGSQPNSEWFQEVWRLNIKELLEWQGK